MRPWPALGRSATGNNNNNNNNNNILFLRYRIWHISSLYARGTQILQKITSHTNIRRSRKATYITHKYLTPPCKIQSPGRPRFVHLILYNLNSWEQRNLRGGRPYVTVQTLPRIHCTMQLWANCNDKLTPRLPLRNKPWACMLFINITKHVCCLWEKKRRKTARGEEFLGREHRGYSSASYRPKSLQCTYT